MMKHLLFPVIVTIFSVPIQAQHGDVNLSGEQYVETQLALLNGVTEMLNLPTITDAPDEVAVGIQQLVGHLRVLATYKQEIPALELEKAQAGANKKARTHAAGQAFLAAINKTAANNFYNSSKLAGAIRELSIALELL